MEEFLSYPPVFDSNGNLIFKHSEFFPVETNECDEEPILLSASSQLNGDKLISIVAPRNEQRIIAQGRDFYIMGKLDYSSMGCVIPNNAVFSVRIKNSKGEIVRNVSCSKKDDIENQYVDRIGIERIKSWNVLLPDKDSEQYDEAVREERLKARMSCIPDFVYDKNDSLKIRLPDGTKIPKSLTYTWNKAYYTDTFFAALIYGGEYGKNADDNKRIEMRSDEKDTLYDGSISPYDENKKEIVPLEKGEYIVEISFEKEDESFSLEKSISITIGDIPNKVLFSGGKDFPHLKRMISLEKENQKEIVKTLIWDPIPGSWIKPLFMEETYPMRWEEINNKPTVFGFISNRNRANHGDMCEYQGGNFHFYNYKVHGKSNSLQVELAEVLRQKEKGSRDLKGLHTYCYDMSSPDLPTNNSNQLGPALVEYDEPVKFLSAIVSKANGSSKLTINGVCSVPVRQTNLKLGKMFTCPGIDYILNILYNIQFCSENDKITKSMESYGIGLLDEDYPDDKRVLEFSHTIDIPPNYDNEVNVVAVSAYTKNGQHIPLRFKELLVSYED